MVVADLLSHILQVGLPSGAVLLCNINEGLGPTALNFTALSVDLDFCLTNVGDLSASLSFVFGSFLLNDCDNVIGLPLW